MLKYVALYAEYDKYIVEQQELFYSMYLKAWDAYEENQSTGFQGFNFEYY